MITTDPRLRPVFPDSYGEREHDKALARIEQDIEDLAVRPDEFDTDAQHDKGGW